MPSLDIFKGFRHHSVSIRATTDNPSNDPMSPDRPLIFSLDFSHVLIPSCSFTLESVKLLGGLAASVEDVRDDALLVSVQREPRRCLHGKEDR